MRRSNSSAEAEIPAAIRQTAAHWRVRRERGLTAMEEQEFMDWLDGDERHAIACGDLEATIETLTAGLQAHPVAVAPHAIPSVSVTTGMPRWRRSFPTIALVAAACVAIGLFLLRSGPADAPAAPAIASARIYNLPDGSVIETNAGARVTFAYTSTERRVRLISGEAHFTVAKHQPRPFIVETDRLTVRAVGTAFDVRLQTQDTQVLVTEGRVQVGAPHNATDAPPSSHTLPDNLFLDAGNRLIWPVLGPPTAEIQPVSAPAIDAMLSWRSPALVFTDATLAEVIAAFNKRNAHQLVIDDAELASQRFGGTFRPESYDAVVRLLEADFGVTVEEKPGRTLLHRSR